MKKDYQKLLLEVTLLASEDIVRTSSFLEVQTDENELPFVSFNDFT
ncbi:MAG: hypothetical protein IJ514_00235 [Clostridia bacterium]|nr:hypothetical protein [Clostridia bacterium]